MVNKCSCRGCFTNLTGHDQRTVFRLPKKEELANFWLKFINRMDIEKLYGKYVFVCEKHFETKYFSPTKNRTRLLMHLNPIPTLFSESQKNLPASLLPKVDDNPTRFPIPKKNLPEKKETLSKLKEDKINSFEDLNSSLLEKLGEGFIFKRFEGHALLFILQYSNVCPKVTSCIRIDMNLRIQLFYKDSPVPLPK